MLQVKTFASIPNIEEYIRKSKTCANADQYIKVQYVFDIILKGKGNFKKFENDSNHVYLVGLYTFCYNIPQSYKIRRLIDTIFMKTQHSKQTVNAMKLRVSLSNNDIQTVFGQ